MGLLWQHGPTLSHQCEVLKPAAVFQTQLPGLADFTTSCLQEPSSAEVWHQCNSCASLERCYFAHARVGCCMLGSSCTAMVEHAGSANAAVARQATRTVLLQQQIQPGSCNQTTSQRKALLVNTTKQWPGTKITRVHFTRAPGSDGHKVMQQLLAHTPAAATPSQPGSYVS